MAPAIPCSLSEGAAERSEAEGVYFDEWNRSKISEPIRVFVQIFGPKQPSDDTPSVSHSLDSSLMEGAGNAIIQPGTIQCIARKPQRCGRFSSPLRRAFSIYRRGGKNLTFPLYNSFQIMYSIVEQSRKPCVKCCWNGELYGRRRTKSPR